MLNLLPDDQNDGHFRGLFDMAKVFLLQDGWFDPTLGQEVHGRRVPDKSKHFHFYPIYEGRRSGNKFDCCRHGYLL